MTSRPRCGGNEAGVQPGGLRRAGQRQRGIELGSSDPVAYNYLGMSHAQLGDTAEAIQDYQKAVELNPRYAVGHLNLAFQYLKQGDSAKAQESYRKACAISDELCRQYAHQFSSADK